MMQQALVVIALALFVIGIITGFLISLSKRTGIGKLGACFVGGVGSAVGGIASIKALGTLKESQFGGIGVGAGDLLPSIIAGIVSAAFFVYVVGRIGTSKST